MAEINVIGKVKMVGPEIQVSASFVKRELVVTTNEQYPQHILINFVQDKTDLIDRLKEGDEVNISVNLRGREWLDPKTNTNRYFNDIQGWKVSSVQPAYNAAPAAAPQQNYPPAPANSQFNNLPTNQAAANFDEEVDDLPF